MSCDVKIRPFTDDTELTCERDDAPHDEHQAVVRGRAWPGSETLLTWQESDRRTFRGEWARCGWPVSGRRCVLPAFHRGNHAR